MQTPGQVADLDGQPWIGQVHGHAINPPVQPQPATTMIGGQLLEESPAPAGQAARQPDTCRVQVRGEGYFRAYRLLVRFPEQFFDGVALRAQIQAPHSSHRTPRHRDNPGSGSCRQPECAADVLDALAAATDHAPRQPAADDRGNLACPGPGREHQARPTRPTCTLSARPHIQASGSTSASGSFRFCRGPDCRRRAVRPVMEWPAVKTLRVCRPWPPSCRRRR